MQVLTLLQDLCTTCCASASNASLLVNPKSVCSALHVSQLQTPPDLRLQVQPSPGNELGRGRRSRLGTAVPSSLL